jgi:uncharacterized protein YndB with AHSA1/START domain
MPKVVRRRRVAAPAPDVWRVVSDPEHMPRWWPRTSRVENVRGSGPGASWTQVLETRGGRGVRADYRCTAAEENERFAFEQQVEGTPFEKVLRASAIELRLTPDGDGTEVEVTQQQKLRGLSRFGSPMMRRGAGKILSAALQGLDEVLGGGEAAP